MDIKFNNISLNDSNILFGGVHIINGDGNENVDDKINLNSNDLFDANKLTFSPALTIFIATIASLMSLVTIIGNVFVITAFIIEKGLRKYSNYFILNLSIADLLIGVLIPPYAPFLLYKRHWKIGRVACTIWLVLDYVVGSASVLCIVVISLDRYLLVSRGLNYVASQKISKAICIMITVWAIAFLNYAPAIIFWEFISGRRTVKDGECQVEFHDNLVYLTATACVEFFVPLISICTLNLAVYLNIRKRSRGLIRSENPKFNLNDNNKSTNKNNAQQPTTSSLKLPPEKTATAALASATTTIKEENLDLNKIDQLKSKQRQKSSNSSCSSSISSLENEQIKIIKRNSKQEKLTNKIENETLLLTHKNNIDERKKSVTLLMVKQANATCTSIVNTQIAAKTLSKPLNPSSSTNINTNNNNNSKNTRSALTKDKKAARSLFILVFVFVICWAPYTFLTLIKAVCPTCVDDSIYELAFWLLWFNSTFNPILYPFLHVKFRKAFLKIIHFILFCFEFKRNKRYYKTNTKTKK